VKLLLTLLILPAGFYTSTYAAHLWRKEKNKLGGFGVALISIIGTIAPIVGVWLRL